MSEPQTGGGAAEAGRSAWVSVLAAVAPMGAALVAEALSKFLSASEPDVSDSADLPDPVLRGVARGIERASVAQLEPRGDVQELSRQAYEVAMQVAANAAQAGNNISAAQSDLLAEWITVALLAGVEGQTVSLMIEDVCPYFGNE